MRMLAIKLLMELRGMAREELSKDEIDFVEDYLRQAHTIGWGAGTRHVLGAQEQGPACETCSDGGHEHG